MFVEPALIVRVVEWLPKPISGEARCPVCAEVNGHELSAVIEHRQWGSEMWEPVCAGCAWEAEQAWRRRVWFLFVLPWWLNNTVVESPRPFVAALAA